MSESGTETGVRSAYLFSGQGQQYVGMGAALCERHAVAKRTLDEADAALGEPLSRLIADGTEEALTATSNAQPALLAVGVAYLRVLEEHGHRPDVVAGHSLGEYTALVAAGCIGFQDAVRIVRTRGQAMQEAVPRGVGGMRSLIGLDAAQAEEACRQVRCDGGLVEVAVDNCPGNVVVSGRLADLERVADAARALGATDVVPLEVSAPFHSSLLLPAARMLRHALEGVELRPPNVLFYANVSAELSSDPDRIRDDLVRQVFLPLRWRETLERILGGCDRIIQVGPGRALIGHVRRIERAAACFAVDTEQDWQALLGETTPGR